MPQTVGVRRPSEGLGTTCCRELPQLFTTSKERTGARALFVIVAGAVTAYSAAVASAQPPVQTQDGRYQPLNQMAPPGMVGQWAGALGRADPRVLQPVRVVLPSEGRVVIYGSLPHQLVDASAPTHAHLSVGHTYRLRIADMPEFPGVALFPSVEIIDRLHAPANSSEKFPIPIEFTVDEIDLAIRGRLVTKVVYLEQPQLAQVGFRERTRKIHTIPPYRNLLAEADAAGRPMAIVRLGGRTPDTSLPNDRFFGPAGPLSPGR